MKKYPKYKPSDVEWIGEIPEHWEINRLKYEALVQSSNVDKKSNEDEKDVLLCNYMDVYKNEFIDESMNFMEATATEDEIRRFKIVKGDVLVTKDSETPDDIANPALVKNDLENVVCAYHLTQIRPTRKKLYGEYLFRLFQEHKFNGQFQVNANGVTRFGLSISSFSDAYIPLPTTDEQTSIANYLDKKTAQIDQLIAKKQQLIELLKEERTAIINYAVTKGIDPHVKLKPSGLSACGHAQAGIEWLGDIPEHWEIKKLKYVANLKSGDSISADNIRQEDEYPVYVGNGLRGFTSDYSHEGELVLIGRQGALCGNINYAKGKFWASEHAIVVSRFNKDNIIWLGELLRVMNLNQYSISAAQPGLSVERIQNLFIPYPAVEEQQEIGKHIETHSQRIECTVAKIMKEIKLLQEYRTALISEVVTGKIKVI
ncbi:MAG: restriction endonuclease subunit S [Candidatus Brocadiaceae bacterium]|nr:restriction endonuclease subunit S [Candidatus Brocadiaceae bacterium]